MSRTTLNYGIIITVLLSVAVESTEQQRMIEERDPREFKPSISSLRFPSVYHATGNIRIPSAGIVEPFEAWYAGKFNKSRIDYYGGTVKTFQRGDVGKYGTLFEIIPKYDYRHKSHYQGCWKKKGKEKKRIEPQSVLPKNVYWPFKMNLSQYKFQGLVKLHGVQCTKWMAVMEVFNRTDTYIFHATDEDTPKPVKLEMQGYDVLLTSYYDHYIVDYKLFESWVYDDDTFRIPQVAKRDRWCQKVPKNAGESGYRSLNPIGEFIDDDAYSRFEKKFKSFKNNFGKVYKHEEEHRRRMHIARHNMRFIHSMNRRQLGFDLDVNHFVDMTDAEYNGHRGMSYDTQKETEKYERGIPILGEDIDSSEASDFVKQKEDLEQNGKQKAGKQKRDNNDERLIAKRVATDFNGATENLSKTLMDQKKGNTRGIPEMEYKSTTENKNGDIDKDFQDLRLFMKQLDDISHQIDINPEKSRLSFQKFLQNPKLLEKAFPASTKGLDGAAENNKTQKDNDSIVLQRNTSQSDTLFQAAQVNDKRKEVFKINHNETERVQGQESVLTGPRTQNSSGNNTRNNTKLHFAITDTAVKRTKLSRRSHKNRKHKSITRDRGNDYKSDMHALTLDEVAGILDDQTTEDQLLRNYKSSELYQPKMESRDIISEDFSGSGSLAFDENRVPAKKDEISNNAYADFFRNWERPSRFQISPFFSTGVEEVDPETGDIDITETDYDFQDQDRFPKEYYPKSKGWKSKKRMKAKRKLKKKKKSIRIPEELDWRKYGAVPPVQSQGICGSCWTFSTAAAVESSHFIKTGKLVKLSEQQLLDCTWYVPHSKEGNHGCMGGWTWKSFAYIKDFGLATSRSYGDYLGMENSCKTQNFTVGAKIDSFMKVKANSAPELMKAIANYGPATASINTEAKTLKFYKRGVYSDKICNGATDHSVLIVGYGKDNGKLFWIVRNSWGKHWGEDGYIKIKNGRCGLLKKPWVIINRKRNPLPWQQDSSLTKFINI